MNGRLVSALGCNRKVRVLVAVLEGPAQEICSRHHLGPGAARQAAEGLVAAALLSSQIKGEERLTVVVQAESPLFSFTADFDADGGVRARFRPEIYRPDHRFSGVISVLKSLGPKELYRGHAAVVDEPFEGALQRYLTTSAQVDGRVRIGVKVVGGEVVRAAGFLVERFPDFSAEDFAERVDVPLAEDLEGILGEFAFGSLAGEPVEVLDARDLFFHCSCSRERVVATLKSLGQPELTAILVDPGYAEVTCNFCNSVYRVEAEELHRLLGSGVS